MKIKKNENTTKIFLSADDTFKWANRPNSRWPCSTLSDKRLYIELDKHKNIIEIKINGRHTNNIDSHELRSCLNDFIKEN